MWLCGAPWLQLTKVTFPPPLNYYRMPWEMKKLTLTMTKNFKNSSSTTDPVEFYLRTQLHRKHLPGKTCFKIVKTCQESQGKRERSRGGPCSLIPKPVFLIIVRFTYQFSVLPAGFWLTSCFSLEHICDYALDLCYDSHLLLMRGHNFCRFCCCHLC